MHKLTTAPGRPKKLRWYFNVLLLLLFFSGFWYELSGWACSLHAACWLNRSSLLVLILEQQNSTNQKKTGQNGERIVRTFHVNIFSHLFRPKLLWKTNLKRIKSYRIYILSNSRPEQVTEVIFIKYLWEENSLFLYKIVNYFTKLRNKIIGDGDVGAVVDNLKVKIYHKFLWDIYWFRLNIGRNYKNLGRSPTFLTF